MSTEHLATFGCYTLVAFYIFAVAYDYLTRTQLLPYYRDAVGKSMAEIDARVQPLILGLLRAVGGCAFVIALAFTVILAIPFREGQPWAGYALAAIGAAAGATALYSMSYVKGRTPAHPPIWGPVVVILLSILGLILFLV
jgi:hypothetical protein